MQVWLASLNTASFASQLAWGMLSPVLRLKLQAAHLQHLRSGDLNFSHHA